MYRSTIPLNHKPHETYQIHRDVVRFLGAANERYLFRVEQDSVIVQHSSVCNGAVPVVVPERTKTSEFVVRCNAIERINHSGRVRCLRRIPDVTLYLNRIVPSEAATVLCVDSAEVRILSGKSASLHTVEIRGVLKVNDKLLLRNAIGHGFGRAKSLGCGLMMLL